MPQNIHSTQSQEKNLQFKKSHCCNILQPCNISRNPCKMCTGILWNVRTIQNSVHFNAAKKGSDVNKCDFCVNPPPPTLSVKYRAMKSREKVRDLTQSYDKSPYTNRNVIRAKWQHKQRHKKVRLHSGCGPTLDGQLEWFIFFRIFYIHKLLNFIWTYHIQPHVYLQLDFAINKFQIVWYFRVPLSAIYL